MLRRRQRLTLDELHHLFEAGVDPLIEIAFAEGGCDGFRDDAVGHRVGEHPLETVTHFDADAMIVLGDEQQRAIIDLLAAHDAATELPLLDHADRVLRDVLRAGRRYHEYRELRALRRLEGGELLLESGLLAGGKRPGEVGNARGERRHRLQAGQRSLCRGTPAQGQQQQRREARVATGAMRPHGHRVGDCPAGCAGGVAGDPGALVSKLTVGAVEICCSLATVKFGFTWKPNTFAVILVGKLRTVTL